MNAEDFDRIRQIVREEIENQGWISCDDKLPDYMQTCIIHADIGFVTTAQYTGIDKEFSANDEWYTADAWRPMPVFTPSPTKKLKP